MKETNAANRYHVETMWLEPIAGAIQTASDQDLEKWAHDPNCIEMEECAKEWARRLKRQQEDAPDRQAATEAEQQRLSEKRQKLQDNPFDPRTEVSADAIHIASRIVNHLWIIFVLLPFVAVVLWAIVSALK